MEVLLLTFANDRERPLPTLAAEYTALNRILLPQALRQHFFCCSISHASLDDIAFYLTLFRDRLSLFLFSGHAGRDSLHTVGDSTHSVGIAHLLGQCRNLKVVILNGCSTNGQVKALHDAGVPLVIATSAPVDDDTATKFSTRLFQALETGISIEEAFELAVGEAMGRIGDFQIFRSAALPEDKPDHESLWGIISNPSKPDAAGWKLPVRVQQPAVAKNIPNERLLDVLYETFAQSNPVVRALYESGAILDERKEEIVAALLKSLPAPISEHVRKLLVPSQPGTIDGCDTVGPSRLTQLVQTYQICMDFLLYVLMAQLWENILQKGKQWHPPARFLAGFKTFLHFNAVERRNCDYFSILRLLRDTLDDAGKTPFIAEFTALRENFMGNEDIKNACFFLETLRKQTETVGAMEIPELCARAEQALASIFSKLGFLGRYLLATVRNIDVQKYRHTDKAEFEHMVVKWRGTLGFYEKEYRRQFEFMDNRSVVLLHSEEAPSNRFLNLSPFILDENTFEPVPDTSLSKLYFFAWHTHKRLIYKFVNDPVKETIDLDAPEFYDTKRKKNKFQLAKDQFGAFYKAVFNEDLNLEMP